MKFRFSNDQVGATLEALDVSVKTHGLQVVYNTVELVELLSKPVEKEENSVIVELNSNHLQNLSMALDTTIKQLGLKSAYGIISILEILKNPLEESTTLEKQLDTEQLEFKDEEIVE